MTRARLATVAAIALALLIAALVSSASGGSGPSLPALAKQVKKLKKKVAALQKQQGPAGAPGEAGPQGAPGAPGTARAYVTVDPTTCSNSVPFLCAVQAAHGVISVRKGPFTGVYCIAAPGLNPTTTSPLATVVSYLSGTLSGDASATIGNACQASDPNAFTVNTMRNGYTVIDGEDLNTPTNFTDTVGFTLVIP